MREVNTAIGILRALARPERLRLLAELDGPVDIGALAERTGIPLKTLAKQLGRLEAAGLVTMVKGTITPALETMAGLADALERQLPITEVAERHGLERFFKDGVLTSIPVDTPTQA